MHLDKLVINLATKWIKAVTAILAAACVKVTSFPPRVAIVKMQGLIASEDEAFQSSQQGATMAMLDETLQHRYSRPSTRAQIINLQRFEPRLKRAFAAPGIRAVALLIDSPGGSPAQSSLLYERLLELRRQFPKVKLLAFVEDAAVSGGYYIACAAEEIIADPNSIIGSVGVISRGFGFVKSLKKQGVERRVQAAGDSKAGLDPYLPMRSRDIARQRRLLAEIHANFIASVRKGRKDKLNFTEAARLSFNTSYTWMGTLGYIFQPSKSKLGGSDESGAGLFDGSVYSGSVAQTLGLVDRVGDMRSDLERRFGRRVQLVPCEPERSVIDLIRLLRFLSDY